MDETGKDDRTPSRNYGYSLVGKRAMLKTIYVRGKRFTVEAALGIQGILAYRIQENAMNSTDFYEFIINDLVSYIYYLYKIIKNAKHFYFIF